MLVSLSGRIGIVTGGGSGIGKAVAMSLARAGANVAVLDRDGEAARRTSVEINTTINAAGKGGSAMFSQVDVTSLNELKQTVQKAQENLDGTLTCAVNCAGITVDGFMLKMTEDQWDKVLDVNLKGTFFLTQAVAQAIIDSGGPHGSIVNISSIIGKIGNLGQANYSASKGGVISFTKTCAKELARYNIRVNAILPGFIDTPMAAAVPDKVKNKIVPQIPLGRFGEPDNIASMCTFLASDHGAYITGAAIEITGGYEM